MYLLGIGIHWVSTTVSNRYTLAVAALRKSSLGSTCWGLVCNLAVSASATTILSIYALAVDSGSRCTKNRLGELQVLQFKIIGNQLSYTALAFTTKALHTTSTSTWRYSREVEHKKSCGHGSKSNDKGMVGEILVCVWPLLWVSAKCILSLKRTKYFNKNTTVHKTLRQINCVDILW